MKRLRSIFVFALVFILLTIFNQECLAKSYVKTYTWSKKYGSGWFSYTVKEPAIKVYLDGNWDLPISSWTLDYVVDSSISILIWGAIVFGIPAIIIGLIWLSQEIRKNPWFFHPTSFLFLNHVNLVQFLRRIVYMNDTTYEKLFINVLILGD